MAYNIPFSDSAEHPELPNGIRVEDLSLNTANTSLTFVGKNFPEFSVPIGKNFLHLLENFASVNPPSNAIVGQLWYDTNPTNPQLKVKDRSLNWIEVSGNQSGTAQPSAEKSKVGDLWTDTANKQLYLFDGTSWVLVGPQYNAGTDSGFVSEQIVDRTTDTEKTVLTSYVNGIRVAIISKDAFFPKAAIDGFERINQGITLSSSDFDGDGVVLNKFWGTSEKADSLIVGNSVVAASNFLRGDVVSTTNFALNIRNSAGLRVGESSETTLSSTTTGKTYLANKTADSAIYLRPSNNLATPVDVVTVTGTFGQVGINKNPGLFPDAATIAHLDVSGNMLINGILKNTNTTESSSVTTGSVQLSGGASIAKNVNIGGYVDVGGHVTVGVVSGGLAITPRTNEAHDIGADSTIVGSGNKRFRSIYSKNFYGADFYGSFNGNVNGNVTGEAGRLATNTVFSLSGDVSSSIVQTNGAPPRPTRNITRAQRAGFTARVFTGAVDHQYLINMFVDISIPVNSNFNVTTQPITNVGFDNTPGRGYWFEYSTPTTGAISPITPTLPATSIGTANVRSGGQFVTTLSDEIISSKSQVVDSLDSDFFLVYRASLNPGLRKINKQTLFSTAGLVPPGSIFPYAGSTPPPGYLFCDGSEQNQGSYSALFGVIGYSYKPANLLVGYNTFALPDLRGRFPIGREVMDNGNTVSIQTTATNVTRNAITTVNSISASFVVATTNITNGPFQAGKALEGHGLNASGEIGAIVITNVQANVPSTGFTTITVSTPQQLITYPAASGLTLTSIGSIDAGGGNPAQPRTPAATAVGVVGGSSSQTLTVNQLPQHKHTLRGSAGNQYYAFRYAAGTPTDTGAIVGQNHNAFNGIHMLPDSGNMDAVGAVGQPFDIVNPYQTINYIIFTGVI